MDFRNPASLSDTERQLSTMGIGRLGAVVPEAWFRQSASAGDRAQIDMIERRILRIEMALRRAGIEVESIDLP